MAKRRMGPRARPGAPPATAGRNPASPPARPARPSLLTSASVSGTVADPMRATFDPLTCLVTCVNANGNCRRVRARA